jgi:hypothetical protein
LSSPCVIQVHTNKRNKISSTQGISFIHLIWQHVSTSERHLQTRSTKYIKGIVRDCITFLIEISGLQGDKINDAQSTQVHTRKVNNQNGLVVKTYDNAIQECN